MLLQFSVDNYRSFDHIDFSMRATSDKTLRHHVVDDDVSVPVLRGAAIYGANGAGKSNLVRAMSFARKFILKGTRGDETIRMQRCRVIAANKNKPSRFEFIFRHKGTVYSYGFAVTESQVVEEWLFSGTGRSEARWFERTTNKAGKVTVEPGPSLKRGTGAARIRFLEEGTRQNQLFLTECRERNVESILPVVEWFNQVLTIIEAESEFRPLPVAIRVDVNIKEFLTEFLKVVGTGITRVDVKQQTIDLDQQFLGIPDDAKNEIHKRLDALEKDGAVVVTTEGSPIFLAKDEDGEPCLLRIITFHQDKEGKEIEFSMEEESDGTQRLFHLIPGLFKLKTSPHVLVIDELDRRLHTELTRFYVQQALDCKEDDPQGQLIFTTHDTNLLDRELLRRDEIWLVEKDISGISHFASLAEWKIRSDLEIEKNYLAGRFGAIPFFGDVNNLPICSPKQEKKGKSKANSKKRVQGSSKVKG